MILNILWADDHIKSLYDDGAKQCFNLAGIRVIKTFINARLLKDYMGSSKENIDAVVVDANFPDDTFNPNDDFGNIGLIKITQWMNEYSRICPFILYTGRMDLVNGKKDKSIFSYFYDNDLIVRKQEDGIPGLINKIKEEVERRRAPHWVIKNKYPKAMTALEQFDELTGGKAKDLIVKFLIGDYESSLENLEKYFNEIRSEIIEKMMDIIIRINLAPKCMGLSPLSKFLCGQQVSKTGDKKVYPQFKTTVDILPTALRPSIEYVVKLCQDGSHGKNDVNYKVREYVLQNNSSLLIHSMCYGIMEIMTWFIDYICKNQDLEINETKWKVITNKNLK